MFYSSHVNREYQLRELIPYTYPYSNDIFLNIILVRVPAVRLFWEKQPIGLWFCNEIWFVMFGDLRLWCSFWWRDVIFSSRRLKKQAEKT